MQQDKAEPALTAQTVAGPLLNVTVPAFNEEACLVPNVRRLIAFLKERVSVTHTKVNVVFSPGLFVDYLLSVGANPRATVGFPPHRLKSHAKVPGRALFRHPCV